jgi:hypothetical protein
MYIVLERIKIYYAKKYLVNTTVREIKVTLAIKTMPSNKTFSERLF